MYIGDMQIPLSLSSYIRDLRHHGFEDRWEVEGMKSTLLGY
jgi:hypothetical protein